MTIMKNLLQIDNADSYRSPEIGISEINVERGFCQSDGWNMNPWDEEEI